MIMDENAKCATAEGEVTLRVRGMEKNLQDLSEALAGLASKLSPILSSDPVYEELKEARSSKCKLSQELEISIGAILQCTEYVKRLSASVEL